jgi:fluoride exporter
MIAVSVLVFGGIGAVLRFASDRLVDRHLGFRSLWPIALVNLVGSFVIGVIAGLVLVGHLTSGSSTVLTAGFCGGFTTWSTASVDTVILLRRRRVWTGTLHGLGLLIVATGAAGIGMVLAGA